MTQAPLHAFLTLGGIILAVVWLPVLLQRFPLTLPMLAVAFGYVFFWSVPSGRFFATYSSTVEILLEFVLVIAVMGAGLKIDRPFGLRRWASTWRLLGFGMPLTVAGIAAVAFWVLDIPLALAALIGAILAPTDPVLASNVQLGPPGVGEEGEVRFALTSEAGLNDGLAYPFVTLGLLLLAGEQAESGWFTRWVLVDILWKLPAAVLLGLALGWGITALNHHIPRQFRMSRSKNGLAAVGVGLFVYGLAELAHCYGFVAVFVAGATIRGTTDNLDYTRDIHGSAEQIEQLVMVLVLTLFGGALAEGLIAAMTWREVVFAVLALLVVRPLVVLLSFVGSKQPMPVRAATGFFGTRGLGTLYYTTFVIDKTHLAEAGMLWRVAGLSVLLSVVIYGLTATPIMRRLDRLRARERPAPDAPSLGGAESGR